MILYLAYASLLFLGIQLINTLLNFIFIQRLRNGAPTTSERISILIPARNEEDNIPFLLADLSKCSNPNLEIVVFDDESTDGTANVVENFAKVDNRIRLIRSNGLPVGWLGKNHACHRLAQNASGNYLLFLDADVRIDESVIADAVVYLKKNNLKLLTVFPTQLMMTFGERISVPIMNYILLSLLPLIFVRISPFASHAAANGQFMLFDADIYKKIKPHQLFKNNPVEDIAIARYFKKQKLKLACITGEKRIKCRMYKTYNDAVNGFSKNVFMFFGNIPILACFFWAFSFLGFIPVIISLPQYLTYYLVTQALVIILYSFVSKQNILYNIVLFPFHLCFLTIIIGKALYIRKNKKLKWKERVIYS
ncbi:MAG: glycosyltransferase [Bacteroidales bacterium]